jgi:acyl-[acyl-carrier-protein]-phospholipid O-acyltransferase/long-chain-fatty-acid--[acyl-carrier-protein] ligase
MDFKMNTVGRFMPEMKYKLEKIEGIEDAGQLHVSGPNIMQGYLLSNNPGKLVTPESKFGKGWYDTGDIVNIDEDGFISIRGRSKRFAKVSGEMGSLTAVEAHAAKAWPDAQHASTSLSDPKKGEQVILLTTQKNANSKQLSISAEGVHAISLPKKIFVVNAIPVFATGKINYPEVTKLAESLV